MSIDQGDRGPSIRVATQLGGGLRNQLFQYAAGRALAERLGARLILDCTPRHAQFRPIVLDCLAIDAEIVRDGWEKPHRRYFRIPGTLGRRLTDFRFLFGGIFAQAPCWLTRVPIQSAS